MRQTELRGYLPALRRWWPEVVASALIAGVAAALIAAALPKTYEARSQLLVGPVNATADGQRAAATLARTYAELIVSESFLDAAVNELQLSQTPEQLTELVRATGSNTTRFVVILAEQDTPEKAAELANFLADRLIAAVAGGVADSPDGAVSVIDRAAPPTEASGPGISLLALAGAMAGGLGALLLAMAAEYFGDAVRDGNDIAEAAGRPLLGTVDMNVRTTRYGTAVPDKLELRRIAIAMLLDPDGWPRSVAVVPIDTHDGSTLTMEIARALTEFGKRVTVVRDEPEAIHESDGIDEPEAIVGASGNSAGSPNIVGTQLSAHSAFSKDKALAVVANLLNDADVVLVASPSLVTSPHGLIWSSVVDSTILSAYQRGATRKAVLHATEALVAAGATIDGVVMVKGRAA
jgi:capsular polysaccharide biosynthesis protein